MKYYRAFSFLVFSEINLDILPEIDPHGDKPDINIIRGDSSNILEISQRLEGRGSFVAGENYAFFKVEEGAWFSVENGNTVIVCAPDNMPDGLIQVYVLGSCFGAILHQRDFFLLHGSCICHDDSAYLIIGDSGSGKSTLSREFIRNGWKLVTDDVSAIKFCKKGIPFVIPSYPSQKLWMDAVERYSIDERDLLPLWQENRSEKYNADSSLYFNDSEVALNGVIWLHAGKDDYNDGCVIEKINGLISVDVLMHNLYRSYFRVGKEKRNLMFQQCVALSSHISVYSVLRDIHGDTAAELYRLIENTVFEYK